MHKHPPIIYTSTKNPASKTLKKGFILNYKAFTIFRGLEQLSNSIWPLAKMTKVSFCVT